MKRTHLRDVQHGELPADRQSPFPAPATAAEDCTEHKSCIKCSCCSSAATGAPETEDTHEACGMRCFGAPRRYEGTGAPSGSSCTGSRSCCCSMKASAEAPSGLPSCVPLLLLLLLLAATLALVPQELGKKLLLTSVASVAAFVAADLLMPVLGRKLMERGFAGRDLHKPLSSPLIPEAGGLCCIFCFLSAATAGQLLLDRQHQRLVEYPAALLGATSMGFLGFADDALALPWRVKLLLPLLAAAPILAAYSGRTTIVLPLTVYTHMREYWFVAAAAAESTASLAVAPITRITEAVLPLLQQVIDLAHGMPFAAAVKDHWSQVGLYGSTSGSSNWVLMEVGVLYYVYMTLLTIFCTNAINIYAGINGLEVGQSLVIAAFVCAHNVIEVSTNFSAHDAEKAMVAHQHFLSLVLCLPFFATSLALLKHNWYPSRIFVGDTYTYFGGIVLAAAGILGHFSKTLLLFFIPQCINFLLSLPQLIGIVPCPRHRTPRYLQESGLLAASPNLTLINAVLWAFGPMTEQRLLCWLLLLQTACCVAGLLVRYNVYTFLLFS